MCHGVICELPLCTGKVAGGLAGGVGRPKSHPSVRGRDKREKAYMALHAVCEACGKAPATECHHLGGRGLGGHRRATAELQALCSACHGSWSGKHSTAARV